MCGTERGSAHPCCDSRVPWAQMIVSCGRGCMGKDETGLRLETYKAHFKAELESVDKRLADPGKA